MNSIFNRNQRFNNDSSIQHRTNYNHNSRKERSSKPQIICQLCDKVVHSAKSCCVVSSDKSINYATINGSNNKKWLMTQLLLTSDHANLSVYSEYDGTDKIIIGDGSSFQVTHIGSMTFSSFLKLFKLHNIFCVPNIHQNLIYVHNFTCFNNVFIDFHPFFFLVKNQSKGATLFRDKCRNGIYPIPMTFSSIKSFVLALVDERKTSDI